MNDIKSSVYAQKVELLLRLIPIVMEEHVFAIHGGTAINLFLKDLPRYSVDIDLTYIPLADRQTSLDDINLHLKAIADKAKKAFKGRSNPCPVPFGNSGCNVIHGRRAYSKPVHLVYLRVTVDATGHTDDVTSFCQKFHRLMQPVCISKTCEAVGKKYRTPSAFL